LQRTLWLTNEHQEDENVSYDRVKHSVEASNYSTKIKEFTLNGCDGAIFETAGFPGQKDNVTYQLLYKDGNRLLQITRAFEKRDPTFSNDSLIEMLQKFK